ncbi:MAG: flagellar biosynthesis protein FliQ [Gammaproteobacteria bacterium]|nr:flagellar biosynthesis protein FliQ [Gammaproteobacteria bacterium]
MSADLAMSIGQRALELTIVLMLIMLLPALMVGLLVSMVQAATQINEMTLSFIPKLLVTVAVLVLAGPYMLQLLTGYTTQLYQSIPGLLG